jgi:hypothetical protein
MAEDGLEEPVAEAAMGCRCLTGGVVLEEVGMGWADMDTEVVEVRGKGIEGVVAYGSVCKSYVDIVWHSEVCTYVNDFGNNVFRIL